MREVTIIERNDSVFVRVVEGDSAWEQQMHDAVEASEFRDMLIANPVVSPFEVFTNSLIFKFPLQGHTREERMMRPEGSEKCIQQECALNAIEKSLSLASICNSVVRAALRSLSVALFSFLRFLNMEPFEVEPEKLDAEELPDEAVELLQKFESQIVGQERAINFLVKTIMRFRAGLNAPNRTLANLLFLGPTGVGKFSVKTVEIEVRDGRLNKNRAA